ncbi:MAG: periplasmic heavy metal sensor [Deltaproteobacteria bacterium]
MRKYVIMAAISGLALTASIAVFAQPWTGSPEHGAKMELLLQLSPETQKLILSELETLREENAGLREEMKLTRNEMKAILTAAEFDEDAFKSSADKMHSLMNEMFATLTDTISEIAPQLTQQEREILARIAPDAPHHRGAHD